MTKTNEEQDKRSNYIHYIELSRDLNICVWKNECAWKFQFIQLILQLGVAIWCRLFLSYYIYHHIFSTLSVSSHLANIKKKKTR